MAAPDDAGIDKMNDAYLQGDLVAVPGGHAQETHRDQEKRINLERKAFKLDDEKPENPFAELIKAIQGVQSVPARSAM